MFRDAAKNVLGVTFQTKGCTKKYENHPPHTHHTQRAHMPSVSLGFGLAHHDLPAIPGHGLGGVAEVHLPVVQVRVVCLGHRPAAAGGAGPALRRALLPVVRGRRRRGHELAGSCSWRRDSSSREIVAWLALLLVVRLWLWLCWLL